LSDNVVEIIIKYAIVAAINAAAAKSRVAEIKPMHDV